MSRRGLSILRRILAGVLLLTLASGYADRFAGACAATSVAVVSPQHSGCEHETAARCAGALACASISPAWLRQASGAVAATGDKVLVIAPAGAARDLFQPGPPTPPPNTI